MIRPATNQDFKQISVLCKEWFNRLAEQEDLDFECDETSLIRAFDLYSTRHNGLIIVAEENNKILGFLAGVCTWFKVNCEQKIAEENYCYGKTQEIEDALKKVFESWAKEQGSNYILNSCYDRRYTSRFRRV